MQQRFLGRTGLRVSRLGLGTLTWGRDTDEHEARDQLIAFTEAGGTLLDTAAGYGDGASEELIGSLIGDVVARDDSRSAAVRYLPESEQNGASEDQIATAQSVQTAALTPPSNIRIWEPAPEAERPGTAAPHPPRRRPQPRP